MKQLQVLYTVYEYKTHVIFPPVVEAGSERGGGEVGCRVGVTSQTTIPITPTHCKSDLSNYCLLTKTVSFLKDLRKCWFYRKHFISCKVSELVKQLHFRSDSKLYVDHHVVIMFVPSGYFVSPVWAMESTSLKLAVS